MTVDAKRLEEALRRTARSVSHRQAYADRRVLAAALREARDTFKEQLRLGTEDVRRERDEAREALRKAQAENNDLQERLHRCRSDYHAKVLSLQKKLSVYRGGGPPADLPDDWVGEAVSPPADKEKR